MVTYNNNHKLKVGIFDSGIGGLPVYYGLKQELVSLGMDNQVSLQYLGDTQNFPYGTKSEHELYDIVSNNIRLLLNDGCSVIGIACNTASIIYNKLGINNVHPYISPIVNLSAQKAAHISKSDVYVISSNYTANSHAFRNLITQCNNSISTFESGEQTLVQAIEENDISVINNEISKIANSIPRSVDTLILGCTHFSHVKSAILKKLAQLEKDIKIIDPTDEMVSKLMNHINSKLNTVSQPAKFEVIFSGNVPKQIDLD